MRDKLKEMAEKAKTLASSVAMQVGDLNGDGKIDEEDFKIAAEWARKKAGTISDEATRLSKDALRSDMVKDAAAGAAVGAAIAVPVPVVGPIAGATIGAGLGVCKNIIKKESSANGRNCTGEPKDLYAELIKLDELKQKQLITEEEFEFQKKALLREKY